MDGFQPGKVSEGSREHRVCEELSESSEILGDTIVSDDLRDSASTRTIANILVLCFEKSPIMN